MQNQSCMKETGVVARASVFTQKPLNTDAFKHKRLYTQTLLHTALIFTQTLLHKDAFTQRRFYTRPLLYTGSSTH